MSELAATALRYADILKFRIHPLRPRSKIPATPNGLKDATDNPDIIRQWWTATPDANISVATGAASGVWVLDIDGSDGAAALTTLIAEHGALPVTPEQTTRNGRHIFFKHPGGDTIIRNRTNIIKTPGGNGGIDVRGDGGYVVIAPSQHPDGGHYQWSVSPSKIPFAHAPDWLINLVLKKDAPSGQGAIPQTAPERQTTPTNDLWNDYGSPYRFAENIVHDQLNAVRAAFEGSRNHTLNIAALKLGKLIPCGAVSYPQAHDWLLHAAIACGLPRAEAEATIKSGLHAGLADPYTPRPVNRHDSQTRQSPSPATPPLKKNDLTYDAETGEVLHMPPEQGAATATTRDKFHFLSFDAVINMPPVKWAVEGIFPEKSFGVIYGEPGKGKTFAALDIGLCVAAGMAWHDRKVSPGSVLYIAGEGMGGLGKRLKAWQQHYAPHMPAPPFHTLAASVNMRDQADIAAIIAGIDAMQQPFRMIFIDTVARALLGGDENSATDIGQLIASCDIIKEHTGACVIGIHHSGKDEGRGMRGSSALLGAVDTCIRVKQDANRIVTLKIEKQKDAEPVPDMAFNMSIITTGFGEDSIVLTPTDVPRFYQKMVTGQAGIALKCLHQVIVQHNMEVRGCPACLLTDWQHECAAKELCPGAKANSKADAERIAFGRAVTKLESMGIIAKKDGRVWLLNDTRSDDDSTD